jgi:hypothetical protein
MALCRANQRAIWANGSEVVMQHVSCHQVPLYPGLLLLPLKRQFPPSASLFSSDCSKLGYRPGTGHSLMKVTA